MELIKSKIVGFKDQVSETLAVLAPSNVKRKLKELKQMSVSELLMGFCRLLFMIMYHSVFGIFYVSKRIWVAMMRLMQGPPAEQVGVIPFGSFFLSSQCTFYLLGGVLIILLYTSSL